jgi:hypothetical protein
MPEFVMARGKAFQEAATKLNELMTRDEGSKIVALRDQI